MPNATFVGKAASGTVPPAAETFGELLRLHRLAAGLAQETLADRARLSVETISALERGVRQKPYLETIALLADALGLSSLEQAALERAATRRIFAPRNVAQNGTAAAEMRSCERLSNNLPIFRTAFVGREREVAEGKDLLTRHHLLTLVGSGGVGKTRLATQIGAEVLDRYRDGVWLVDFSPITDPQLVASVVAQALGVSQQEGRRVDEAVAQWLRRKQLLLILDNCEHLLEKIAALADVLLTAARDVRIVATSRQSLHVSGEVVHHLQPLAVPADVVGLSAHAAARYGAVALFVDRATAADTRFEFSDRNAGIVAQICRRLDGIALAIELAAARVKVISLSSLAQRLDERFKLLSDGNRGALPRQKTLSALIDWSYDLLSPREQRLFARLGIFAGGFDLDAAAAVCGGEGLDPSDVFDLLASLTDQSLVVADISSERERYRLLESMAAYALAKLDAAGERERLARRHAEYFREQAETAEERFRSLSTAAWRADAEREIDNYRAALEWSLRRNQDAALGGAIAGALERIWREAGLTNEGRYWVELALPLVSEAKEPAIAARLELALSLFSAGKQRYDAAERAARLYESVGDIRGAVRAEGLRAFALQQMGRLEEARDATLGVLASSRALGEHRNVAYYLNQLASIEASRGELGAAREACGQALSAMKARGDEFGTALALGFMAEMEFVADDPEHALRLANEALALASLGKNLTVTATWHVNIAAYRIALGDLRGAGDSAREGLRIAAQVRNELSLAIALQHLALLAALDGDLRSAAALLGYVDARYDELGMKREPTERWGYTMLLAVLQEQLTDNEIGTLGAEGAAWWEDHAVAEALRIAP